jgi:hypothetical protein
MKGVEILNEPREDNMEFSKINTEASSGLRALVTIPWSI